MFKVLFLICLSLPIARANLHQAPPPLNLSNKKVGVFVDFKKLNTLIKYDLTKQIATAQTEVEFEQSSDGSPIFDLVNDPTIAKIDDEQIDTPNADLDNVSKIRYVNKTLTKGSHKLFIENLINTNIRFSEGNVRSAFWMSDLSDRQYLEQYIPSNLEYDQYEMIFEIQISETTTPHTLYTNGQIEELGNNHWKVTYPKVFTASSIFYHLIPQGSIPEMKSTYTSINNNKIPVTVYTNEGVDRFMNSTLKILAELEKDYGPWPHNQVIVYGAGSGGMEYCGATITSLWALGHELTHSYFARGMMPAHGNSGWVDEAMASWRDDGYRQYSERNLSRTKMAGHSIYKRTTDRDAYSKGMRFIGYLDNKFSDKEGMKKFMRFFYETNKFSPFKTEIFKSELESYFNVDLTDEFEKYVYGNKGVSKHSDISNEENPMHPKLTAKELQNLL